MQILLKDLITKDRLIAIKIRKTIQPKKKKKKIKKERESRCSFKSAISHGLLLN